MPRRKKGGDGKDVKKVRALDAFVSRLAGAWRSMGNTAGAFAGSEEFGTPSMVNGGGRFRAWQFPAGLTGYERHCVHAMAETHGLHSESVGEGSERHIIVAAPGIKAEKEAEARALASAKHASDAKAAAQADGKSKKLRKATVDDLLGIGNSVNSRAEASDGPRVEAFRKQVEYGPKKFIKP